MGAAIKLPRAPPTPLVAVCSDPNLAGRCRACYEQLSKFKSLLVISARGQCVAESELECLCQQLPYVTVSHDGPVVEVQE